MNKIFGKEIGWENKTLAWLLDQFQLETNIWWHVVDASLISNLRDLRFYSRWLGFDRYQKIWFNPFSPSLDTTQPTSKIEDNKLWANPPTFHGWSKSHVPVILKNTPPSRGRRHLGYQFLRNQLCNHLKSLLNKYLESCLVRRRMILENF